jgi:hypothetical protein
MELTDLLDRDWIEKFYHDLCDDDEVQDMQLFRPVLRAAWEVLQTPIGQPMPYDLELVQCALVGALTLLDTSRDAIGGQH